MANLSVTVSLVAVVGKPPADAGYFSVRTSVRAKRSIDGLTYQVWNDAQSAYTVVPAATFEAFYAAMPAPAPGKPPNTSAPTSPTNTPAAVK